MIELSKNEFLARLSAYTPGVRGRNLGARLARDMPYVGTASSYPEPTICSFIVIASLCDCSFCSTNGLDNSYFIRLLIGEKGNWNRVTEELAKTGQALQSTKKPNTWFLNTLYCIDVTFERCGALESLIIITSPGPVERA